jgi:DNA-binding response OmpR family regulator
MSEPTQNILVVEDNPTIGAGLVTALEHERFDVRHVESAEDGVLALQARAPDLVICDIMLPGQDGLSLMRQIKTDYPGIPVIMLTAKA